MVARIAQFTLDVIEVESMARFWSQALGYEVRMDGDGSAHLVPPADASADVPTVWLQATGEEKRGKNRHHPDLRPKDGNVGAEVERLIALGARHIDVGQTADDPFVVLADPEGNEFCVLRGEPRRA